MDAPKLPSISFGSGSQVGIAAIHSACVCGVWPRALMESAGRCLITSADSLSPVAVPGLNDLGLTCFAITFKMPEQSRGECFAEMTLSYNYISRRSLIDRLRISDAVVALMSK